MTSDMWDPFRPSVLRSRRPRRIRRAIGIVVVAAIVGGGAAAAAIVIPNVVGSAKHAGTPKTTPTPSSHPGCATARAEARTAGKSRLGVLAWVAEGALHTFDLDGCHERTLVASNAAGPVRFSHDGRWVAFGDGSVVGAEGGTVVHPMGRAAAWQWSPTDDVLAAVTDGGGVEVGGPSQPGRSLLPEGSGVGHLAFSPDGRELAADAGDHVEVIEVSGGTTRTVYRASSGTHATPEVAGWSPDGRWVLFWAHLKGPAGPLDVVQAGGGEWMNVFNPVLPYGDFMTWCGRDLAFSGGSKGQPSKGDQILVSGPPAWRFHNLSADFIRSWIWPACSPSGAWIAATATPNRAETPPGYGVRSLWLLSTTGGDRHRLTDVTDAAFEASRWSSDGRFLIVVRRGLQPTSPGQLLLIPIDPHTGKAGKVVGPVADLGKVAGPPGHPDWSDVTDWYRPA
jgi:dipeptidyl aminopeptidase/acylaminoacyl peptidase